jgi:8-oxo-dGTP diphosphatase
MDLQEHPLSGPLGVASRAIISQPGGRILLVRRTAAASIDPGSWELPGGKLKYGETLRDGLIREVQEETGLSVEPGAIVHVGHRYVHGFWVTVVTFVCSPQGGTIYLSEEHDAYRWADPQNVKDRPLTPGTAEQVEAHAATG